MGTCASICAVLRCIDAIQEEQLLCSVVTQLQLNDGQETVAVLAAPLAMAAVMVCHLVIFFHGFGSSAAACRLSTVFCPLFCVEGSSINNLLPRVYLCCSLAIP